MRKHTLRLLAVSTTYFALSPAFAAEQVVATTTATTASSDMVGAGTAAVPASRIATRFESLAGSPKNAESLVAGLRNGNLITLTSPDSATSVSFTPTTRPMGYGNVTQALSLAQRQLAAQGITNPTPEQLHIALNGGTLTSISSSGATRTVEMAGVLQLRSQGMGWGQIAHQVSVGPGNRLATAATTAPVTQGSVDLRGSTYSRGAIVSGDGSITHGRAPGYASSAQTHTRAETRGPSQTRASTQTHASGPSAAAGSSSISMESHGKSLVQARGNGRL